MAPAEGATLGTPLGLAVGFNQYRWADPQALVAEFDAYARLGVRHLRTDLYWSVIQAAGPSSFDWAIMDRVVDLAWARGIALLPVVGITPDWAWSVPATPSPPRDPQAFAHFLGAAVARYAPRGFKTWEIWNEPNLSGPWPPRPDPVLYATILEAGSAAIRAADPEATIILGGLAAVDSTGTTGDLRHHDAVDFLRIVYDRIGSAPFDAVGFHPYSYPDLPRPDGPAGWGLMAGPIRHVMDEHGDVDKPVWITEYGAPTNLAKVSETAQAMMLERAYDLATGTDWIGPLFWYSFRDRGDDPNDPEDWFGLIDALGREKSALETFKRLAARAPK